MNRKRFTKEFMSKLRKDLRARKSSPFIAKYKPELRQNKVYVEGKLIIPQHQVEALLEDAANGPAVPLGIRSMQHVLKGKYWGITRSMITNYLQSNPILASIRTRPNTRSVDRSQLKGEGSTDFILKKYPNTLGVDLIELTRDSMPDGYIPAKYRARREKQARNYVFVCVHKRSGYLWAVPIVDKEAITVKKAFIPIKREAQKRFGVCKHLESDGGLEFRGEFADYLRQQNIGKRVLRLVPYVERANSTLQRYFVFLAHTKPYEKALKLAVSKFRNIKSRVTGKVIKDVKGLPANFRNVPGEDGKKERQHRKWKGGRHKKSKFAVGDKVRYLKKMADRDKSGFYRSYVGSQNKSKWSAIKTIVAKHAGKYQLDDNSWRKPEDLIKSIEKKKKKVIVRGFPKYKVRQPKPPVARQYALGRPAKKAMRRKNKRKKQGPKV